MVVRRRHQLKPADTQDLADNRLIRDGIHAELLRDAQRVGSQDVVALFLLAFSGGGGSFPSAL
jgi:hypothetical protein